MPDLNSGRDLWTYIVELTVAAFAGSLGAMVRLAQPTTRRVSLALLWELPTGGAIGCLGWALAGSMDVGGWGRFVAAWTAGALGQAVVLDLATAFARKRLESLGLKVPENHTGEDQ